MKHCHQGLKISGRKIFHQPDVGNNNMVRNLPSGCGDFAIGVVSLLKKRTTLFESFMSSHASTKVRLSSVMKFIRISRGHLGARHQFRNTCAMPESH